MVDKDTYLEALEELLNDLWQPAMKFREKTGFNISISPVLDQGKTSWYDGWTSVKTDDLDHMIVNVYNILQTEYGRQKIKDKEIAQRLFELDWKSQSKDGKEKPYSTRHIGGRRRYLQKLGKEVGKK